MEVRHEQEANLAYIYRALAERTTETTRDPQSDEALALRIMAFLAEGIRIGRVERAKPNSESRMETRRADNLRWQRVTGERGYDEPLIINFERAKAEILSRRSGKIVCGSERKEQSFVPRLRIFRGE